MASCASAGPAPRVATAAIDFGTSGTSAVVALSASKNDGATVRVALDGRGGDGSSGKSPTAILLQAEAPHNFVAFGLDAFARYKDAKVKGEASRYLLFSEFKMELRPGATRYDRGDPQSFLVGAADRPGKFKLLLPVVETLRHAKTCALQQLLRMRGTETSEADVSWVLTVPAIWDDEARAFMRVAAEQAGIGGGPSRTGSDSPSRLALALEPEAAAIAAIPSVLKIGHRLAVGDHVMIVDAGGGTIDINVSEVIEVDAVTTTVSLSELTMPSGGPFGGTAVDREFTRLLSSCARKKRIPPSSWLGDTRREFLKAKESYDFSLDATISGSGAPPATSFTVDITDVLDDWGLLGDRKSDLESWKERVVAAAARFGKVSFSQRRGCVSITMDAGVMASFFEPVVDAIGACIQRVAARKEAAGIKCIILAGGFAASNALRRHILALYPTGPGVPVVVVVDNPSAAIAEGAVRYGLSPNAFVASRLVRHSFGIMSLSRLISDKHRLATKVEVNGTTFADVVQRLVPKGFRATTARLSPRDPAAIVTSHVPIRLPCTAINFQFVRTSLDLPDHNDPERVAVLKDAPDGVAVPLTTAGLPQTVFVPRACQVADITVPMPQGMKTADDGECIIQFHFGRTEIEAEVTVIKTGEVRRCAIKYLNDRPTSVAGASHAAGDDLVDGEASDEDAPSLGSGAAAAARLPSVRLEGLPPAATEHDLLLLLIEKGAPGVRRVVVPRGPDGRSLACGVVVLHAAEDGEAVVAALHGERIRGGVIRAVAVGAGGVAAGMRDLRLGGGASSSRGGGGGAGR